MNSRSASGVFVQQFGKTKIEHLRLALAGDHHVAGFDIAMNYSLGMSGGESVGYLDRYGKRALQLQRLAVDQLAHVATRNVLHRNEVDAVDDVEIENCADVGVVQ